MALPELFLQELKLRNSIEDVASSYVQLKGADVIWLDYVRFIMSIRLPLTYIPKAARFIVLAAVQAEMSLPLSAALKIWIIWKL